MKSFAELLEVAVIMNRVGSRVGTVANDWKGTASVEAPIRPGLAILIPTHRGNSSGYY